jgi:serine/threonine protein kinase
MGSLQWQLERGWEPWPGIVLAAAQVADALRYIHSRGMIHGDVKPANIFFVGGIAKLGDFGTLAEAMASATGSTAAQTPGFRAPEQVYSDLRLRASRLGYEARRDVYQLASTILYALTGSPLDGEEAVEEGRIDEALRGIRHGGLRSVLREMLEPDPARRIDSGEASRKLLSIACKIIGRPSLNYSSGHALRAAGES